MGLDGHRREAELFGRALELAPGEQRVFLERECGGDGALAERVLALLARDREATSSLDRSALERIVPAVAGARMPERIGPYRILGLLGEGGMGLVYRAEQESPRREVALKVLRGGLASLELVRRFEKEAQVLGRLDHQGIARVHDAGVAAGPSGPQPFVTMELVEGEPLLAFVERRRLPRAERLELLARVCDAVAHAHDMGIVHRDLKPSNVVVKPDGQPKVLDFGVALIVGDEGDGLTRQTFAGELIGTLPYMSPEQLAGDPTRVDARADVYALGVMAYELLTGRRPHELDGLSVPAAARLVSERSPTRLGSLDRSLRGDLETIVSKALELEREQRYASVRELAGDLRRYLRHEPVRAVPPSSLYLLRRFARRNPALATSLALAALLLVTGTVVSTWQARRAEDARQRAEGLRTLADERALEARRAAGRAALAAAQISVENDDFATTRRLLASIEPAERGWVWRWLDQRSDGRVATFAAPEAVLASAFVAGTQELVVADAAGTLARWSPVAGTLARIDLGARLTGPAAFDREGAFLAGVHGDDLESLTLWDAASGRRIAEVPCARPVDVAVAPGGRFVAFGGRSSFLWDTSGAAAVELSLFGATGFAFSPDGSRLGISYNPPTSGPGWFALVDVAGGRSTGRGLSVGPGDARGVAMGPEGQAAVASRNKRVHRIDLERRAVTARLTGSLGPMRPLAFDSEGARVAGGSDYGLVHVWDAREGRELAVLGGSRAGVRQVAFSGDGELVLAVAGNEVGLWDVATDLEVLPVHTSYAYDVAFVRGGARLVSVAYDGELRVRDAASLELLHEERASGPASTTYALDVARDGDLLALARPAGVVLLDGDSLQPLRTLAVSGLVRDVAFSPDGSLLAACSDLRISLLDAESGAVLHEWSARAPSPYPAVAFARDGRAFACSSRGGVIVLEASGAELARLEEDRGAVEALAFSPDGATLASGSTEGVVRLWDTRTWSGRAVLEGHTDRVYSLAFSPDGELLASGSNDTSIRLWSVASGEELALLGGHEDYVYALAFDPDGTRLASASGDRSVRLWDTLPRAERWRAAAAARARRAAGAPER